MSCYEKMIHGTKEFPIGIYCERQENGLELYPHFHREFEFFAVKKGQGVFFIDGKSYAVEEGDCLFVNSGELHLCTSDGRGRAEFVAVVFAPEFLGDGIIYNKYVESVLSGEIKIPSVCGKHLRNKIQKYFAEIYKERQSHKCGYELRIKSIVMNIWRLCLLEGERRAEVDIPKASEEIKKAIEYIRKEFAGRLSLSDIANQANMSKGYFCKKFFEMAHMTPFEYLVKIRIENSREMLRETNLSIGEIGEKCGFFDFSYFSKMFRKHTGMTPMQYRKSAKGS